MKTIAQSRFAKSDAFRIEARTLYRGGLKFRARMSYVPDFKGSNLHSALWEATAKKSAALRSNAFETGGGSGLCAGSLCERYILSDVEVTAARGFSRSKLLSFFDRIWEAWWEIPFTPSEAYKRKDNVESPLQKKGKKSDRDWNNHSIWNKSRELSIS